MGGVILPHPSSAIKNPALVFYPERPGFETGYQIPLGLLGLLAAERNPLLYLTDRDAFISGFDALSFYDQASHLDLLLLNPAESMDEVVFLVSEERIRITDEDGDPLVFRDVTGPRGISIGGTPLIPPPLFSIPTATGQFHFTTGFFAGNGGYSMLPNSALEKVLEGEDVAAEAEYAVIGNGSIQAGVSQSVTFAPVFSPALFCDAVYLGVRLVGFYTASYLQADFGATTETDGARLPSSTDYDWELFYLYPGKGGGYGARIDTGIAFDCGRFTWGVGILNLVGFAHLLGTQMSYNQDGERIEQPDSRLFYAFRPEIFTHFSYRLPLRECRVLLAGDIGYTKSLNAHGGLIFHFDRLFIRGGVGWEGRLRLGLGYGLILDGTRVELAFASHEAPFTGGQVFGVALNIATIRRDIP